MKLVKTKIVCGFSFVLYFFATGASATEVKPLIQAHTMRQDVVARANLVPMPKSSLTGTLELQKVPDEMNLLITLSSEKPGQKLALFLSDEKQCPGKEGSGTEDPKPERVVSAKKLGVVTIGKVGKLAHTLKKQASDLGEYHGRAAFFTKANAEAAGIQEKEMLSCGLLTAAGKTTKNPMEPEQKQVP